MNEEAYVPGGPSEPAGWDEPVIPAEPSYSDTRGLSDRIDQLESALGAALSTLARQEAMISSHGFAQRMAQEMGRPDGASILAQEIASVPGLSEAAARFPLVAEMAKAWAAQKLSQATKSALSAGERPLPTSLTGAQGHGVGASGRQKQLAGELQKMAEELGVALDDQDAMEVFANV